MVEMSFWYGKKIFITGHTGFKGSWLSLWLQSLGAEVHGYAMHPPTNPNMYTIANVADEMASSTLGDIRDLPLLTSALQDSKAEFVFHLAAQPLVRHSYLDPVETYSVNVMGTVNLFEAARNSKTVRCIVNVTTDKCYENHEWVWPYRETESMGGYDPYSSSKGCSELITAAYRQSFFTSAGISIASARAGNVIGGGDWASDRLIPDFLKALDTEDPLVVRSPLSIRPWQHVLEPLYGYMKLAEQLYAAGKEFSEAWNFGPAEDDAKSVEWIVNYLVENTAGASWKLDSTIHPHEATYLKLDSSKARSRLRWKSRWDLEYSLKQILDWHSAWKAGENMKSKSLNQIKDYQNF